MVWPVFVLVFSIQSLETWEFIEKNQLNKVDNWGLTGVDQVEKVRATFSDAETKGCEEMYETDEAPYAAIILFRTSGRLLCMGSIVDTRHILTAKKCFEKADASDVLILLGYYKAYWGKNSQVVAAERIVRNEYAIALVKLRSVIKYTNYVKPTRLPASFTAMITTMNTVWPGPYQIVGFPIDRFDVPGEYIDNDKMYTIKEDSMVPFDDCKSNYSKLELDEKKLFCTFGNATYCWGGWGSPVMKWVQESYFLQIGVVIADNCTAEGYTGPLLCARTDIFGDWIRGNTWQGHQPT